MFFVGACVFNHRFLLQTNLHPIAREDCHAEAKWRGGVFVTSSEVPRYPGTQVPRWKWRKWIPLRCLRHTTSRRRSSLCLFPAQIQIEAVRFYEIVGSLCTEGSSSKAWMLSVKGSFRWRRRRFVRGRRCVRCVGWYSELAVPSREIQTFSESVLSTMNLGFLGPRWNITPSPPATLYLRHKLQCYKVGQSFATFFEDLTLMQIASNLISNVIIWVCTITYMAREMLRTATCSWFFVLFAFDLLCLVFALCLPTFSCVCQCIFLRANHVLNHISS